MPCRAVPRRPPRLAPHRLAAAMLPGVGVFGTGLTARVIVPLLKAEGFAVKALWGRTPEEAEELAKEMSVPFYTSRIDEVLLHQDVDLVCVNLPPPLTRQVAVKTLDTTLAPEAGLACQNDVRMECYVEIYISQNICKIQYQGADRGLEQWFPNCREEYLPSGSSFSWSCLCFMAWELLGPGVIILL